jgi:hypothetical protein
LDEGANIDPKIPEEDDDSLDPKSSEVKEDEEEYDVASFLPSILSLSKTSLSALHRVLVCVYNMCTYILYTCVQQTPSEKTLKDRNGESFFPGSQTENRLII